MKKKIIFLLPLFLGVLVGCNAAISMNGKVMSVDSGQFVYQDGNLISNYKANIDSVWTACEKTVKEMKGNDIRRERKISTGRITAIIQDEKVSISIEYIDKDSTSVAVFVGVTGNNVASRLIHEKIADKLVHP
ncbi:MAG: DUF3568 family protein [Syntrophaceae bacterium]|nr:DUF3568 family protein [Syntrophaceae bacterium]